jgi:ribosomal protein S14
MKTNFINGYKKGNKQCDKYCACIRCGRFTIFHLSFDLSKKDFRFMLLNLGFELCLNTN